MKKTYPYLASSEKARNVYVVAYCKICNRKIKLGEIAKTELWENSYMRGDDNVIHTCSDCLAKRLTK